MRDNSLVAIQKLVLSALQDLAVIIRKLRTVTEAEHLDLPVFDALGTRWEEQRRSIENFVIRPLPYHVRSRLTKGEESVTLGWVLRFRSRDPAAVEQLEPYLRSEIAAGGGWLRCTEWAPHGPLPWPADSTKALLLNPDWETDWDGVDVAIARAEQVFDEYEQMGRTDLAPNEADIEATIREIVSTYQPDWIPDGKGFEASQFELIRKAGTLEIPFTLEVHALRREIQWREEPCQVEHLVGGVLELMQGSGDLKLFEYKPFDEPKELFFCYLAERSTPVTTGGAETPPENVFRKNGDVWVVRFQGKPTIPVSIKHTVGMKRIQYLLQSPGKPILATDLVDKAPRSEMRHSGAEQLKFTGGAQGDPISDKEALGKYNTALREYNQDFYIAERKGDEPEMERLRVDKALILEQVKKTIGQGGKLHKQGDPVSDKARKTVSNSLNRAFKNIRKHTPELADHLQHNIEQGHKFYYRLQDHDQWEC